MVAYLQDGAADDERLTAKAPEKPKPAGLPLTHEAALKWFYKDPQGEIQGEIHRSYKHFADFSLKNMQIKLYPAMVTRKWCCLFTLLGSLP